MSKGCKAAVKHCRHGGAEKSVGVEWSVRGTCRYRRKGCKVAVQRWWREEADGRRETVVGETLLREGRGTKELAVLVGRGATTQELACCFAAAPHVPEPAGAAPRGAVFPIAGGGRARRQRSTATRKRRRGRRKPAEIHRRERQRRLNRVKTTHTDGKRLLLHA